MASLLTLSADLKLAIIEHLDLDSHTFIPGPSSDLLNLSGVCKALRTISLPYLFRNVVLLSEEKSALSISTILNSPYAEHVRTLHYIGITELASDPSLQDDEPARTPSPDDFPDSVAYVLSNLAKFANLERLIVEFRCGKTEDEDEDIYGDSYNIFEEPEDDEGTIEAEKEDTFRALINRSYDTITQNPLGTIKDLELRNVIAKRCSAWDSDRFKDLLKGLSTFTISLRGGDNGAGWQINMVPAYLSFVENLYPWFFESMKDLKHLQISCSTAGPPGLPDGMNNAALPLYEDNLLNLESLELSHIFISTGLAAFVTSHSKSLRTVLLDHCYSGIDENNCAEDVAISWGDFFTTIASVDLSNMQVFDVRPSDLETRRPPKPGEADHENAREAKELREKFPGRRMFDYKHVDDKYGMLFDSDLGFERFEEGTDQAGWEQLCAALGKCS